MNANLEVNPGAKIEYRRPGSRGRPTVAFVIEKNARSLTVERTTNHEVVKIKPSDVVRLAATGRRMKPTKAELAKAKEARAAQTAETEVSETKAKTNPRPAKRPAKDAVKELTGTARRGRPKKNAEQNNEGATAKEAPQPAKRRGRPRKEPA